MSVSPHLYLAFLLLPLTTRAMVAASTKNQRLSARDDNGRPDTEWTPVQIAAPFVVGGVLLLAFAAYVIWKRRSSRGHPYDYHQVRTDWVKRMFVPRTGRRSSTPMTLADSMGPHFRLNSTDSHTPLAPTDFHTDDPAIPRLRESPPPMGMWPPVRWWWLLGSRPQEVKSEEPGSRWRVDGPDGSSTGHGHTNNEREEYRPRYVLETMHEHEDPVEDGGVGATPTRPIREMTILPDRSGTSLSRTPVRTVVGLPRSDGPGTQPSSGDRGLPPSYDVSHAHTLAHFPSIEETARLARSPPPLRTAGYPSPQGFYVRELSSESFLRAQSPMAVVH